MAVMNREQQELLEQLRALAGDSDVLLEALKAAAEPGQPAELRTVIREILRIRKQREEAATAR
jgi:hypothetical protein